MNALVAALEDTSRLWFWLYFGYEFTVLLVGGSLFFLGWRYAMKKISLDNKNGS